MEQTRPETGGNSNVQKKKKAGNERAAAAATAFLAILVALFLMLEALLSTLDPVGNSPFFRKNDYEKTIAIHGTTRFDKVFYGGSNVHAAYMERLSTSGYVDFGLEYGKLTYLLTMLEKDLITVTGDLVIGLNYFTLMDDLETNPGYAFHRKGIEPYVFFHRNRIQNFFTDALDNMLNGEFRLNRYHELDKYRYHGVWTDERLDARLIAHEERFWGLELSAFEGNLSALEKLIDFCKSNDIHLRAVWMPYNPYSPVPEIYRSVIAEASAILAAHGIEYIDMTDAFPREYFYDMSHLNYETGAVAFTREIDIWLER